MLTGEVLIGAGLALILVGVLLPLAIKKLRVGSRSVLIVDDDSHERALLGHLLREAGITVAEAEHGEDALKKLREARKLPSLILLDLRMPVMDGWVFRTHQLADSRLAAIPVLIISSSRTLEQDVASISCAGFLRKPIHRVEFVEVVRKHCR